MGYPHDIFIYFISSMMQMGKEQIQYVVPVAIFVKDNKMLLGFKHSSCSAECTNKWEILGGKAKFGQSYEHALKAKMKQYLGVDIEILETLGIVHSIISHSIDAEKEFQFFVIPSICKLLSEEFVLDKNKLKDVNWFSYEEMEDLHKQGTLVSGDLQIARIILGR